MVLDVNAGVVYNSNPDPNITEPPLMTKMIELVQGLVDVPLCIDSSVPGALEAGLEAAEGRPLLNSVTGEEERVQGGAPPATSTSLLPPTPPLMHFPL